MLIEVDADDYTRAIDIVRWSAGSLGWREHRKAVTDLSDRLQAALDRKGKRPEPAGGWWT